MMNSNHSPIEDNEWGNWERHSHAVPISPISDIRVIRLPSEASREGWVVNSPISRRSPRSGEGGSFYVLYAFFCGEFSPPPPITNTPLTNNRPAP